MIGWTVCAVDQSATEGGGEVRHAFSSRESRKVERGMLIKTNMDSIDMGEENGIFYCAFLFSLSLFFLPRGNMADARVVCMYLYISFSAFRSCAGVHVRPPVLPDFPHGRGQGHALCGRHVSILRGLCTVDLLLYAVMRGCRIDEAFFLDRFIFFLLSPLLPFSFYFLVSVCLVCFFLRASFVLGNPMPAVPLSPD